MTGEASQKAMTADKGTPMASSAAISGITPQEQKGDTAPASAARRIISAGAPVKARAIRLSAPVAPAQAAMPMDKSRKGAVFSRADAAKAAETCACVVSVMASARRIRAEASQTRCLVQIIRAMAVGWCEARLVSIMPKSLILWLF